MKSYRKRFTPHAGELVRHLPPRVKPFIRAITEALTKDPYLGKALKYDLAGYDSVRHNRYRIIDTVDETKRQVIIAFVGPRENVYNVFIRLKQSAQKIQR